MGIGWKSQAPKNGAVGGGSSFKKGKEKKEQGERPGGCWCVKGSASLRGARFVVSVVVKRKTEKESQKTTLEEWARECAVSSEGARGNEKKRDQTWHEGRVKRCTRKKETKPQTKKGQHAPKKVPAAEIKSKKVGVMVFRSPLRKKQNLFSFRWRKGNKKREK